ncbi:MAG: cobalamin biosynthesis protein [Acidobacteria bacterium]|nr:cobalamin biosynthesis protein [Acidobacteriota bacterium]
MHSSVEDGFAIGFGCSTRATSEDILDLIREVVERVPSGAILATLDRRACIGGLVAEKLGLRLQVFPAAELARIKAVTTQSSRALATTRTANVAEAAALASLGPEAQLVMPKTKGRLCTCAVAVMCAGVLA